MTLLKAASRNYFRMAIFGNSKKKTAAKTPAAKEVKDASGKLANVLHAPWLSEKALIGTEKGVYVFSVAPKTTGRDIALAIEKTYKVTPRKVAIVNLPAKRKALRTRRGVGVRSVRRKAYVYLKKGDTIEFA